MGLTFWQTGQFGLSLTLIFAYPAWSEPSQFPHQPLPYTNCGYFESLNDAAELSPHPQGTQWCTQQQYRLSQAETTPESAAQELELDPEIIENSPVLQRWLEDVPNVMQEIRNDPSFRTRLRLGYSQFPSNEQAAGFHVGVEDIFIGTTGLTASTHYYSSFDGDRQTFGADLRYYLLPLGDYFNVAPVVGYRNLHTDNYWTDGVNVGVRLQFVLSRTGAADIALTQSFVSIGSDNEVGITALSVGYALTDNLRLSADIEKQNSIGAKDSRVGIGVEWMP